MKSMTNRNLRVWAAALILIVVPLSMARADAPPDPKTDHGTSQKGDGGISPARYAANQVVVKLSPSAAASEVLQQPGVAGIAGTLNYSPAMLVNLVPEADVDSAVAELQASEAVEYAQPNYLISRLHPVQGSYPFPDVELTGDYEAQYAATTLQLNAAHTIATGAGVTIGLLDVGVDFTHPLLAATATSGHDFVDSDSYSFDEPGGLHSGHGTFVAGVLHLAAPDAQIKAYRIATADGYGDGFTLAQAIEAAVQDGCDVINLSVVLMGRHLAVRDAIEYATSQNTLVVAAAGNQRENAMLYPAAEWSALGVSAVDQANVRTPFTTYGSHVSLSAPGVDIYSSFREDGYAWWSGTSFSAPLVAGTAALLYQMQPQATAATLFNVLEVTAQNIDAVNSDAVGLLGAGLVDPVAALTYMQGTEQASVTPDTMYFDHYVGRQYFVAPFQFAHLSSTNAPASYFAEVIDQDSVFCWVNDSVGVTNDSVLIQMNPWEVPGQYYNTVRFYVDGVPLPVDAVVHLEVFPADTVAETGWVNPSVLLFQAQLGTEIMLSQMVVVQSTNAPAAFTAQVLGGGAQLATPSTFAGTTPESLLIMVDPSLAFSAGIYEDTIIFLIEGVSSPVGLLVVTEISSDPILTSPDVYLDTLSAGYGTQFDICLRVADGGQAWGGFDFKLDFNPTLLTLVSATPGDFITDCNWEHFAYTSPSAGQVRVVGVGNLNNVPGTPTCLLPDPGDVVACLNFQSVDDSAPDCAVAPIRFWWDDCGDNGIASETGDDLIVAETVTDYTGANLTGIPNIGGPDAACPSGNGVLTLTHFRNGAVYLMCDSIPGDGDSAWVIPDSISFTSVEGFAPTVLPSQWVHVFSSNAPANYVAGVSGPGPLPEFTLLLDSTGTTNDSTEILINPGGLTAGSYVNWVTFYVNGVINPVTVRVHLTVQSDTTGGGGDSAVVVPSFLAVNATAGSTTPITQWAALYSTNAPAVWSGFVLNWPSFVSLPDSVGITNDSAEIVISPAGLAPGVYGDTVVFDIQGIDGSVILIVQLTVGADTIPPLSVYNYPNPFNPQTQISFALPQAAQVELRVFNILGELVTTLEERYLSAGDHRYIWDGRNAAGRQVGSGVYFYRLTVDQDVHTGKMMMVR